MSANDDLLQQSCVESMRVLFRDFSFEKFNVRRLILVGSPPHYPSVSLHESENFNISAVMTRYSSSSTDCKCIRFPRFVLILMFAANSMVAQTSTRHTKTREESIKDGRDEFWGGAFTPPLPLDDNDQHRTETTKQIEEMFRDHSYELSIRPRNSGNPINVGLALMIESITDISEKNMDLTFTVCMHETWTDRRLKFKSYPDEDSIVLPSRLISKLWVPDLYIVGSKSSFIHKTTVDNVILRLFSDGSIYYNVKITTTVACQMNLYNFPLDTENCSLTFQSLGYTSDEVHLTWMVGTHMDDLFMDTRLVTSMPKFQLVHHTFHSRNVTLTEADRYVGKKSELKVSFELKRYLLSVFFQSYFPAMIMVVLAGLGMWIDPKSVPARVALGVTSVLTISTIITGLKSSLPKVSYLTAMDIYLWVCFLFVFSTVLEFCCLNFIMTERGKKSIKMFQRNIPSSPKTEEKYHSVRTDIMKNGLKNMQRKENEDTRYQHHKLSDDVAIIFRNLPSLTEGQAGQTPRSADLTPQHPKGLKLQIPISLQRINPKSCLPVNAESIDVIFRVVYFYSFVIFNGIYWGYYIMATQHEGGGEE